MADNWEFRRLRERVATYKDGTKVPHLDVDIYYNGVQVGYVNLHMHKVKVAPGELDHSVGITVRINPELRYHSATLPHPRSSEPPAAAVLAADPVLHSPPWENAS